MEIDLAMPFSLEQLPAADEWMAAASQTMARKQDITIPFSEATETEVPLSLSVAFAEAVTPRVMQQILSHKGRFTETEFDIRDDSANLELDEGVSPGAWLSFPKAAVVHPILPQISVDLWIRPCFLTASSNPSSRELRTPPCHRGGVRD
jgi:hypothetical protein